MSTLGELAKRALSTSAYLLLQLSSEIHVRQTVYTDFHDAVCSELGDFMTDLHGYVTDPLFTDIDFVAFCDSFVAELVEGPYLTCDAPAFWIQFEAFLDKELFASHAVRSFFKTLFDRAVKEREDHHVL